MTPTFCFSRRTAGGRVALFALFTALSLPAAAADTLRCGVFTADSTGTTFTLAGPDQGMRQIPEQPPEPYRVRRAGNELTLADLDSGAVTTLTLSEDGRHLSDGVSAYALTAEAACQPAVPVAPGTCRADIGACMQDLLFASNTQLLQWCREDVPAACKRLLANHESAARDAERAANPEPEDPAMAEPEVCKEASAAYDEAACEAAAREVMGMAMAKLILGSLTQRDVVLPAEQLDEITGLCRAQVSGTFCSKAAEALWAAQRLPAARDALQQACTVGKDPRACLRAAGLAPVDAPALAVVAATALPCGRFEGRGGLMDTLTFGDAGQVDIGMGDVLQARLENGDILIRHEQNDDFVLRVLANGDLVGFDTWTRFARFHRSGGPAQCAVK